MKAKYQDLRENGILKTGDIVLFSGKSFFSGLIQSFTRSKWSHVGMVVRIPAYDQVLVWESTMLSNVEDINSGELKGGVQLAPLSTRIKRYQGEIAIRTLTAEILAEDYESLHKRRHELKDKKYERDIVQLWRSALDVGKTMLGANLTEDLDTMFCSETVAEGYQSLGLLQEFPDGLPSNEYDPSDFSAEHGSGKVDELLLRNGKLGEEIYVNV